MAMRASGDQTTFDCPMRQLAIDFAHKLQPFRTKESFQQLADALNGAEEAQNCSVSLPADLDDNVSRFPVLATPTEGSSLYVDAIHGSDTNSGTMQSPLKTISKAVTASRSATKPVTIILRQGTFYLSDAIMLGAEDSGLSFQNYNGEEVWLSGGIPLSPDWKSYNVRPGNSWEIVQGMNAFSGERPGPTLIKNGTYDTWEECEQVCQSDKKCHAFIWCGNHTHFQKQCWLRYDLEWRLKPDVGGIVSGRKTVGPNIYVADLSSAGIKTIPGLRVNGRRAIRARYPNADPEMDFGSTLTPTWLDPTSPPAAAFTVNPAEPLRNTCDSYQTYEAGVGGACAMYDPPVSYWGGPDNITRGYGRFMPRHPSGFVADKSILPNTPYKNGKTAIVHAWRTAHWFSLMYEVGAYNADTGNFTFSKGGFQGAEGDPHHAEFYIENVFEELDYPNEWFFDESDQKLYFFYNGSGAPPNDLQFVATQNKVLLNISGSQESPVKGIHVSGINFRDTAYTYLDPHGVPSGGDWGLQRTGAVFLEGTVGCVLTKGVFESLDGIGVMISGYNR